LNTQESVKRVKQVREELTKFFDKISSVVCTHDTIIELMQYRGYKTQAMYDTLKEIGVFKLDYLSEVSLIDSTVTSEQLKTWGLISNQGDYILGGRYVVPIRDISGLVTALVGWSPSGGPRKYVTTPTYGFSRDAQFYNMDCYKLSWEKFNGNLFVVEGIFDTISLRSLGLPAYGNMGLEMSAIKSQILRRFNKIVAIHDNDLAGMSVDPYLNSSSGKASKFIWSISNENVFPRLPKGIKDIDNLIKDYDCYEDLVNCLNAKYVKRIIIES
jgi:DNA primase